MIKMLRYIQQKSGFLAQNVLSWTNMKENPHKNGKIGHLISSKLTFMVANILE